MVAENPSILGSFRFDKRVTLYLNGSPRVRQVGDYMYMHPWEEGTVQSSLELHVDRQALYLVRIYQYMYGGENSSWELNGFNAIQKYKQPNANRAQPQRMLHIL